MFSADIKNTEKSYGMVARALHWVIALLILGLLVVGFYMEALDAAPFKYQLYGVHKALGVLVLGFGVVRIIWTLINERPQPLDTHAPWEVMLAKVVHVALYLCMIGMPLSGWVMSSAGGHGVSFFGLFDLPALVDKDPNLGKIANLSHGVFGYGLVVIVGLHFLGAVKHHVLDGDETVKRMICNRFGGVLAPVMLAIGAAALALSLYFGGIDLIFS